MTAETTTRLPTTVDFLDTVDPAGMLDPVDTLDPADTVDPADPADPADSEGPGRPVTGLDVVVTGVASDAHVWNLVFLQLLLEEMGHRVTNLGPCVPHRLLVTECLARRPHLVVVSTVNGHGQYDGIRALRALRVHPQLHDLPVVIGGKLGTNGVAGARSVQTLLAAGFVAVFDDPCALTSFRSFVTSLAPGRLR